MVAFPTRSSFSSLVMSVVAGSFAFLGLGAMHVIFAGTSPALYAVTVYLLRDCLQQEERVS